MTESLLYKTKILNSHLVTLLKEGLFSITSVFLANFRKISEQQFNRKIGTIASDFVQKHRHHSIFTCRKLALIC